MGWGKSFGCGFFILTMGFSGSLNVVAYLLPQQGEVP
jgi:hypothetical protein